MTDEEMMDLFKNVKFTFSKNCHSGIAYLMGPSYECCCWRCLKERGQASDEITEKLAERNAAICRSRMIKRVETPR